MCSLMFSGCANKTKTSKNIYAKHKYTFDSVDMEEFNGDGFTIEEYKDILALNKKLANESESNEPIISVNDEDISRIEFESQKNILLLKNEKISDKAVAYSIIQNIVLEHEADRLSIELSDDAMVSEYVDALKKDFESNSDMEFIYAYMEDKNYTIDDYIAEAKENIYNAYRYDIMFQEANKDGKYENFDAYVKMLIEKANIKIYDSKLHEICRK